MKNFLLALLLVSTPLHAETFNIGVQWVLPPGHSAQWPGDSGGGCGAPNQGGNNCGQIPAGKTLIECIGTQSIKNNGVEVLARIVAGSPISHKTIWQGYHSNLSTIQPRTPILPSDSTFVGNGLNSIWIEFQANNYMQFQSGGWEMQITCSAQ